MGVVDVVTDGPLLVAAPIAAAAGLLSFLSPCVLPLVPGYLSFITGLSGEDLQQSAKSDRSKDDRSKDDRSKDEQSKDEQSPGSGQSARSASPVPAQPAVATGMAVTGASVTGGAAVLPGPGPVALPGSVVLPGPAAGPGPEVAGRPGLSGLARRLAGARRVGRVTVGTSLFVLGFTAVFVTYGVAFGGLGQWLRVHQVGVSQVLGAITILMGLGFAGVFSRLSWANREWRLHRLPAPGLLGAPVLGVLFGIGWTPCIGPTLAAVLGLAMQSATAGRGAFLSAMYCLGLGLPFLVVGLAFRRAVGALRVVRRHARVLALTGGALLVAVGMLQLTGAWSDLVAELRPYAPGFSETPL